MGMMSNRFANLCLTNLCRRNFSNTALSLQRKKKFTKAQLIVKLSALEYHVTQEKGTEWAWTGRYLDEKRTGSYKCIVCATKLFDSETKYNSNSGWPSFSDCELGSVELKRDSSAGMIRTECICAECGSHLGHVFNDGPKPTGKRYCINGASLDFEEK